MNVDVDRLKSDTTVSSVSVETLDDAYSYWLDGSGSLNWNCLFVLPVWLKAWCKVFGNGSKPYLCVVRHKGELIGIAPLLLEGEKASFLGDPGVCDYLDFIVTPGNEQAFLGVLIEHLRERGITHMDLRALPPDSTVYRHLDLVAQRLAFRVHWDPEDVGAEMELPRTWEDFLGALKGKHRHEIRRKLRRLNEAGQLIYRHIEDPEEVEDHIGIFLSLFGSNRTDKADFMDERMASFFKSLSNVLAERRFLRLSFLDLDARPVAAVMCFDYRSTTYLYNNGYDRQFSSLSVGLLSKVLSIKDSINRGMRRYDFLKGDEAYKLQLGGNPVTVYRCRVSFD